MQIQSEPEISCSERKLIMEFNTKYNNWFNSIAFDSVEESNNKHCFLLYFLEENLNIFKLAKNNYIRLEDIIQETQENEIMTLNEMLQHVLLDNIVDEINYEIEDKKLYLLSLQDVKNAIE